TANTAYALTFGAANLAATQTVIIANNGTGLGTVSAGALSDGGTVATLNLNAPAAGTAGALTLTAAAGTITNGTQINLNAGVLNANNAGALGQAVLNMAAGTT